MTIFLSKRNTVWWNGISIKGKVYACTYTYDMKLNYKEKKLGVELLTQAQDKVQTKFWRDSTEP